MNNILGKMQIVISGLSTGLWQMFLPLLLIASAYIGYKNIFVIRKRTTKPSKIVIRQVIGPVSISMGAMIGTGAIIGVLGALNKYAGSGQNFVQGLLFWTVAGCCIMLPLSYAETLFSKVMNKVPKEMIRILIGPRAATIYGVMFVVLYVFGFGGFQFSGISTVISTVTQQYFGKDLSTLRQFLWIVTPIILVSAAIVLMKKREVFINSMAGMIGFAVAAYVLFFIGFLVSTIEYIPEFFAEMYEDIKNPVAIVTGVPIGLMLSLQRITQTTESGLGGLPMAAHENDSEPRAAATISLIPVVATIFVAFFITTYITSYGMSRGIMALPASNAARLKGYADTIYAVTGDIGLLILAVFTILSGITTLLGSYYYIDILMEKKKDNTKILTYIMMIVAAGVLATFGFEIVFDIVDFLIFAVTGIFVTTLFKFAQKEWKKYRIDM